MTYAKERHHYRARDDAYLGGVCAGLAEYYELDTIVVRILAVLLAGLTLGVAVIVYAVLWARLPLESASETPYEIMPESAESSAFGCFDCELDSAKQSETIPVLARLAVAAGLMILFLAVAIGVSPLVPGTQWWQFWPLGFLMAGLCLIIIPIHTSFEAVWHVAGIMLATASASILPMSLGIMSWDTIGCTFESLWPIAGAAVALFAVGLSRKNDALLLAAAFCFVVFCLAGVTFCVIPGEIETLFFHTPLGHSVRIAVVG